VREFYSTRCAPKNIPASIVRKLASTGVAIMNETCEEAADVGMDVALRKRRTIRQYKELTSRRGRLTSPQRQWL